MSLVDEVKKLTKSTPMQSFLHEDNSLAEEYQKLLDQGLVRRRGYTLQTIDEKQEDVFDLAYTVAQ